MNTKRISIFIPNAQTLSLIQRTDAFSRLFRSELSVGQNFETVNHKQCFDICRLMPVIGVEVKEAG